jgi:hypothetical protein
VPAPAQRFGDLLPSLLNVVKLARRLLDILGRWTFGLIKW